MKRMAAISTLEMAAEEVVLIYGFLNEYFQQMHTRLLTSTFDIAYSDTKSLTRMQDV